MNLVRDFVSLVWQSICILCEMIFRILWPKPLKSIVGEVAVVTGAGRGVGREFALQLADRGAKVVCWDIDEKTCKATAADIRNRGGTAWAFRCDVSKKEEVQTIAKETRKAVDSPVTMLFNNAGIMPAKMLTDFSQTEVERLFSVNVYSQIWTMQEFLPDFLRANHGYIMAMSSVAGITGTAYLTVYCSTKFAVKGLMDALMFELRKENPGLRVSMTTAHPLTVDTGLAVNPTSRFPSVVPIVKPDECARVIIDAVLRGEEEVMVPRYMLFFMRLGKLFPRKLQLALCDFLNYGVGKNSN